MLLILSLSTAFSRPSAAFSVPSSLPETPASSSDSALTLVRNLSMPSAFLASASENFCAFWTVCGQRPAHVLGEAFELGKHVVGAGEDVLRRLQKIGHRRRIGGDLGDRAFLFRLVEQVGFLGSAPFSSMLAWPVRPARPMSACVDLVIGVSRSISVSAMATVGLSTSMIDALDVADLDAVEQHRRCRGRGRRPSPECARAASPSRRGRRSPPSSRRRRRPPGSRPA